MRVMIVDDQPDVNEGLCALVRTLGHEAVGVLSGSDAIDRFHPDRFDLVVIDVVMPAMNGLELIRRVRALDPASRPDRHRTRLQRGPRRGGHPLRPQAHRYPRTSRRPHPRPLTQLRAAGFAA